jgi:hypothetical protein
MLIKSLLASLFLPLLSFPFFLPKYTQYLSGAEPYVRYWG